MLRSSLASWALEIIGNDTLLIKFYDIDVNISKDFFMNYAISLVDRAHL